MEKRISETKIKPSVCRRLVGFLVLVFILSILKINFNSIIHQTRFNGIFFYILKFIICVLEGSRARSQGPYGRSSRRSPSFRDRERSKRSRLDYDRYDRYSDYPSRSPNPYWSPEYYDRLPRSPSRDRHKSKYYEPSLSSRHYKY